MIHGADGNDQLNQNIYPIQIFNNQGVDGYVGLEINQQISDENNSLYNNINIGPYFNNETVDLRSIDSSDLLQLNPESLDLIYEKDNTQMQLETSNIENKSNIVTLNHLLESSDVPLEKNSQVITDVFPNLEEHDDGGLNFELNLNPNTSGKNNWYYSAKLQKVFIRLDQTFYIEALYSPKNLYNTSLFLRAMVVFNDDISSPVQRCHNHMNSDRSSDLNLRHYILRSENSNTQYLGKSDGRNVSDRLSILIPLSKITTRPSNDLDMVKQSIALKFVCQNSCIGRKQTSVIFTLEDQNFRILGKRVVNVKVCSCPKRDKQKDEQKYVLKRSSKYEHCDSPPTKIPSIVKIKKEPFPSTSPPSNKSTSSNDDTNINTCVNDDNFKDIEINFKIPNNLQYDIYQAIFNVISGKMALDNKNTEKYRKFLKEAKRKLDECKPSSLCQHNCNRL